MRGSYKALLAISLILPISAALAFNSNADMWEEHSCEGDCDTEVGTSVTEPSGSTEVNRHHTGRCIRPSASLYWYLVSACPNYLS